MVGTFVQLKQNLKEECHEELFSCFHIQLRAPNTKNIIFTYVNVENLPKINF